MIRATCVGYLSVDHRTNTNVRLARQTTGPALIKRGPVLSVSGVNQGIQKE